jgi:transcriptional regulator with GAF, ATPase, and Fis domain
MDQNEFFRIATFEICGNLSIEIAMRDFVTAVHPCIPIDRMFLQIYESDLGAMRTIAIASAQSAEQTDHLTSMPEETRAFIRNNFHRYSEGIVGITSAQDNPVAAEMLRFHGLEGSSVMHMALAIEDRRLCNIVLTAAGPNLYNQQHADLLALLKRPFTIALFNTLKHREVLSLRDRLVDDNQFLQHELTRIVGDEIIGADFGLRSVMENVRQVASTDSPVLLTGETGVGKDVIASATHRASNRRDGPFIAVNCGAIPESLIDSELFGHEKGAFTGALATRRGRFERAHRGTILLDEVGEMPASAQVRLLRVLQSHEIERVGGSEGIPVDARVIAATNRNLRDMVTTGAFREDLWFRLNVFPIHVPPLRERTMDIPSLVQHFITRKARDLKLDHTPTLAEGVIENLLSYAWPGNVRELENAIERAIIVSRDRKLRIDLGADKLTTATTYTENTPAGTEQFPTLDRVVKEHIERALVMTNGKIHGRGGAGELLGVNPNTLRHRMRKLGISFGSDAR